MQKVITPMKAFKHSALPDVQVFSMSGNLKHGEPQQVLVKVSPGGEIPLHSHNVDARMMIVSGSGKVLSDDPEINQSTVQGGTCVFFEKMKAHGFQAGDEGLSFVSDNGGIVDEHHRWDLEFV